MPIPCVGIIVLMLWSTYSDLWPTLNHSHQCLYFGGSMVETMRWTACHAVIYAITVSFLGRIPMSGFISVYRGCDAMFSVCHVSIVCKTCQVISNSMSSGDHSHASPESGDIKSKPMMSRTCISIYRDALDTRSPDSHTRRLWRYPTKTACGLSGPCGRGYLHGRAMEMRVNSA